ncbi:carbohydrate diacid regulator [Enterococcus sp. PF1-24]|uniref:CdaR family transcriptional regulator n=1 Tax=unclassified Enterococcus TaxID=2608891 RepID=UPI002474A88B|nr:MULTISPECIES: sugar diacid recognition domain-containing protein [unclassified Enterococcus]MDH6364107.1 carbohydrate diacid regulator [Enterococcus sp. PFB1-1]MDH6401208.1 carbohydrate diacid regulator [Enterococcus sp. PF1-24]
MELEPKTAKLIVKNLKDIINFEINLFDTSGTIIASTDRSRIGTSHEGALIAAHTKKILTIDYDNQFAGAKKGINLPVLFNNSVVAIIGITGTREEVEPFGNIIKKMTEILIRENWLQMTAYNQRNNYHNLINMLIAKTRDQSLTDYLASILAINLEIPRLVIIGEFVNKTPNDNYEELFHLIYNRMKPFASSFFAVSEQKVTILMEDLDNQQLNEFLAATQQDIQNRFKKNFVFGIGNTAPTIDDIWQSYHNAQTTVNWLKFEKKSAFQRFSELDLELLLTAISIDNAQDLINKVFSNLNTKEIDKYSDLIRTYEKHNGSITGGAEELFIHKNTFQNKLNRFYEITGYNPRDLKDYVIIAVAIRLRDYLNATKQLN